MKYPIEEVLWTDAASDDDWGPHTALVEKVFSVGYLIREDETQIVLALNAGYTRKGEMHYSDTMAIPKGMILKRWKRGTGHGINP